MSEETAKTEPKVNDKQQFLIQKIYMKDCSFETNDAPAVFLKKWEPDMNVQLVSHGSVIGDDHYGVLLTVTVTAKLEDKPAYLAEVHQAGVFAMKGFEEKELGYMLGSFCPNILFPFARENLCGLITRGGFKDFYISPVNFDVLYAERVAKLQSQTAEQESP